MREDKLDVIITKVDENRKNLNALTTRVDKVEQKLDEHTKILNEHTKTLDEHSRILNEHSKTLDEHTKILNEHSKTLDEHTKILNEHTEDFKSIKRTLAIIEDAVTNKIPALFDANQANQEKHEEFDNRLVNVENISSTNSLKISILEDSSKIHSKQLAKLLS